MRSEVSKLKKQQHPSNRICFMIRSFIFTKNCKTSTLNLMLDKNSGQRADGGGERSENGKKKAESLLTQTCQFQISISPSLSLSDDLTVYNYGCGERDECGANRRLMRQRRSQWDTSQLPTNKTLREKQRHHVEILVVMADHMNLDHINIDINAVMVNIYYCPRGHMQLCTAATEATLCENCQPEFHTLQSDCVWSCARCQHASKTTAVLWLKTRFLSIGWLINI